MSEPFQTFRDIIAAWPSRRALRADLEAAGTGPRSATAVRLWHFRDQIPAENFAALAKAARRRGIVGVTVTRLRAIARAKQNP